MRAGLSAVPKRLPPVLFYDHVGSQLFEQICLLPEYYVTRTERRILQRNASTVATCLPQDLCLIELGCGSAEKTEILLRALVEAGHRTRYLACDVSEPALMRTVARLRAHLPTLDVVPILGDFEFAIAHAKRLAHGECVWVFLGSSLGNFQPDSAVRFLATLRATDPVGLILGIDMVKPARILHAAYDDAAGVTAAFNRNVLTRINRELDADFVPHLFTHCALYRPEHQRIEMHLVSQADQTVRVNRLQRSFDFARGETIHTENSRKYTDQDLRRLAAAAGFAPRERWADDDGWFSVCLWTSH
ncbi:MAG: L-histidine N(alpha)-methyltransferase [Planctomycetota bacterium]